MKKLYPLLIFSFFISAAFSQVKPQTVTKSSIVFHIKNLGITVDGLIAGFKSTINFDPANFATSTIEASVETNTIDTDNGTRNDHLKSDSYFDAVKYPTITIKSVSFKHNSGNNFTGTFNLTIKNVTKSVDVPFSCVQTGNTLVYKGNFQIERTDFGVGSSSLVMSNDVKIDIDFTTTK